MQDLNSSMKEYIAGAQRTLAAGDYKAACKNLAHAAECAYRLFQSSTGEAKQKYYKAYQQLREMLDAAAKKMESAPQDPEKGHRDEKPERHEPPEEPDDEPSEEPPVPQEPKSVIQGKNDALSPLWLSDYVGQPQAVAAVKDLITAARLKNSAMPHLILYGSHGLGKTTFAKIIANEMHSNFIELNVSKITPEEMIAVLKTVKAQDIIFIDEIHTLPLIVAESVLYSAMQDGRVVYTTGKKKFAKTVTLDLPPFTLIGATTEVGKLAKPFVQRAILIHLNEYSDDVIAGIVAKSFFKLGMTISKEDAMTVAKRARSNPRIANSFVRRISDKALVRYSAQYHVTDVSLFRDAEAIRKLNICVDDGIIQRFFDENHIDEWGLENRDRDVLRIIIERFNGGPVGLETLSKTLNEAPNVVSQKYEAYLIKKGFVTIEKDGRYALANAYKILGLPVPPEKEKKPDKNGGDKNDGKDDGSHFDVRSVIAAKIPDPVKCEKIERLIVYPEGAGEVKEDLDTLFPDIQKEYEAEPKHTCKLDIDFGDRVRHIECDSFLESRFACVLAQSGYITDIKAQTIELPYVSQELSNKRYFPDFVIKDHKGRIAIIEMKNFDMTSYHLNIDKYEMLKTVCESKGYGYSEVMKAFNSNNYVSFDEIYRMPVNEGLRAFITQRIEENGQKTGEGICTLKDLEEYFGGADKVDKTQIFTVLLHDRRLKNTDRTGTDFRIILT